MTNRFEVVKLGVTETYYGIKDNRHKEFLLPEHATSIYFAKSTNAETVASILNKEWNSFVRKTVGR